MITDNENIIGVLVQLQRRFEHMAHMRDQVGDRMASQGKSPVTQRVQASGYRRCARELERTINGELPPPEGEVWEEQEEEQS